MSYTTRTMDPHLQVQTERLTNLYIRGFPIFWTKQDLDFHFQTFGDVVSSKILYNPVTTASRGIGFVRYSKHADAQNAVNAMNGTTPEGTNQQIVVQFAKGTQNQPSDAYVNPYGAIKTGALSEHNRYSPYDPNQDTKGKDTTNLYICNLPQSIDDKNKLMELFMGFGQVVSCTILRDMHTGLPRGIGFVRYTNDTDSKAAMSAMHGTMLQDSVKPITISFAKDTSNGSSSTNTSSYGGAYGGRGGYSNNPNYTPVGGGYGAPQGNGYVYNPNTGAYDYGYGNSAAAGGYGGYASQSYGGYGGYQQAQYGGAHAHGHGHAHAHAHAHAQYGQQQGYQQPPAAAAAAAGGGAQYSSTQMPNYESYMAKQGESKRGYPTPAAAAPAAAGGAAAAAAVKVDSKKADNAAYEQQQRQYQDQQAALEKYNKEKLNNEENGAKRDNNANNVNGSAISSNGHVDAKVETQKVEENKEEVKNK